VAENNVKTVNSDQLAVISKKKQANTFGGGKYSLGGEEDCSLSYNYNLHIIF